MPVLDAASSSAKLPASAGMSLVGVPATVDAIVFGSAMSEKDTRVGARTEAATHSAEALLGSALPSQVKVSAPFLAGVVELDGLTADVVVIPVVAAETVDDVYTERGQRATGVVRNGSAIWWCSIAALGDDKTVAVCSLALERCREMREAVTGDNSGAASGAAHATNVAKSVAAEVGPADTSILGARVERDVADLARRLEARAATDTYLREPMLAWVDRLRAAPDAVVPGELLAAARSPDLPMLEKLPFVHRCPVHDTLNIFNTTTRQVTIHQVNFEGESIP